MEHVGGPVHRVPLGFVSAYLVEDAGGAVLVDTGLPGRAETLLAAARELAPKAGRAPLGHIVVTHCHVDHAGSLAAVVAAVAGAPVHAHPIDAAVLRAGGPQPPAIPDGPIARLLGTLFGRVGPRRFEPAPVDVEVQDGDTTPGDLHAIHTPGHTPGHPSLLWPDDGGVLIAGDAARMFRGVRLGVVNSDPAQARRSLARLAELEFDTACFGHGRILRGRANVAFRRRVEQLASRA